MHRGRLEMRTADNGCGYLLFELAPSKTDSTGEKGFTMALPLDAAAEVNAAAAVARMLAKAPLPEGKRPEEVPVFVNPRSGKALTYREDLTVLPMSQAEWTAAQLASDIVVNY